MTIPKLLISFLCFIWLHGFAFGQDSVLGLLKNNIRQGNLHFEQQNYEKALLLYRSASQSKLDYDTQLKIARCYYFLKKYSDAAKAYAQIHKVKPLPAQDLTYFAEMNTSLGNYAEALANYNEALSAKPGDPALLQRVWQLANVHLFFEDSVHYNVSRLPFNSHHAELSPTPFSDGILFVSDRKEIDFNNPGSEPSKSIFSLYYAELVADTVVPDLEARYRNPVNVGKKFPAGSGLGPMSLYADNSKCIFAVPGARIAGGAGTKMQLFFSEYQNGHWSVPAGFAHNDSKYNFTDPHISPDGKTLLFVSDKPGGMGGYDIYRSFLVEGQWTSPENLGDNVNTSHDEAFPFLYYNTLYFSSDGHPGLGGLDIFSTIISDNYVSETKNVGYPLNSGGDDFGFVLRNGSQGFFSSNRLNEGYDDDIYRFEMDFRAYPFDITGIVKMRDRHSTDTLEETVMASVAIELVDHARKQVITKTRADEKGKFSLSIPYFSKYILRILYKEDEEYIVSLEINRESSTNSDYEIMVIKHSSNA
ncbi:MAG TPA: hypothetical protein VGD31_02885, partial [Sphingobacteriaceae bacterium]